MTRLSRVLQDYRDTGPMSTLINLYGFVDDGVFLTKGGDLGVVLALGGVDYECLDPDQREAVTRGAPSLTRPIRRGAWAE